MNIGIVGLGLIGGSMTKALKKFTNHHLYVYDINKEIVNKAIYEGNAEGELTDFTDISLLIIALYPEHTIDFIRENKDRISPDTIIIDCAGIKKKVCEEIRPVAEEKGFVFIGGHPMAGIEKSGYESSFAELFQGASMILTPYDNTPEKALTFVKKALNPLGFSVFKISSPEEHDKVIAFTSQLAHVVSSAYILSPAADEHYGFSAGSFKDMTRVARLNEYMWTELFLENREFLSKEIELLINNLCEFKNAIAGGEEAKLFNMLKRGRIRKEGME